jgi:hypothetical protein
LKIPTCKGFPGIYIQNTYLKEPTMPEDVIQKITEELAAPFDAKEVKWKPQAIKNNSCLAVAYVDVRVIQDRLDEVLGVAGWQDEYQLLPDNSVMCRLKLKFGKRWITKVDVGSPSEQPDGGDRLKAAFSDALKRAAVKFGISRYLYRLPSQWVDYDPVKKKIVNPPKQPGKETAPSKPTNSSKPDSQPGNESTNKLPSNGKELHQRLRAKDTHLAEQGKCMIGSLLAHVTQAGVSAGYPANMEQWEGDAIQLAIEATKDFISQLPASPKELASKVQVKRILELLVSLGRDWSDRKVKDYAANIMGIPIPDNAIVSSLPGLAAEKYILHLEEIKRKRDASRGAKK